MKSRQDVNNDQKPSKLLSSWLIVVVIILGLGVGLYFLYPTDFFTRYFEKESKISVTGLAYLEQLSKRYGDNEELQLRKIRHMVGLGYVKRAEHALNNYRHKARSAASKEEVVWLGYILAREKFYMLKKQHTDYTKEKKKLVVYLNELLKFTDTELEYKMLANDSLSLGKPGFSAQLFKKLLETCPNQNEHVYAKAARSALYSKKYELSSHYFFKAQDLSKNLKDREHFFKAGVSSLEAKGSAKEALVAAQKNFKKMPHNREMMLYLAKVALRANNPSQAQSYLNQILYKRKPKHEKA